MGIEAIGAQSAQFEELQKIQRQGQEGKPEKEGTTAFASGDTVDISEEGRQKSAALQMETVDNASNKDEAASGDSSKKDTASGDESGDSDVGDGGGTDVSAVNITALREEL